MKYLFLALLTLSACASTPPNPCPVYEKSIGQKVYLVTGSGALHAIFHSQKEASDYIDRQSSGTWSIKIYVVRGESELYRVK